MDGSESFMRWW